MLRKLFTRAAAAVIAIAVLLLVIPANAQVDDSTSGLSVTPLLAEYTIKPNEAQTLEITLKNITSGDIIAQGFIEDFQPDNKTGNPQIITDANKRSPNSIRNFVRDLEDVSIPAGQQKKVSITLQTPGGAPPGAYFGVLRFKAQPANAREPQGGEVALSASVGTIVLVTVPGTIKEQVQLSAMRVYEKKKEAIFFLNKPDEAGIEVKNLGNGFTKPFGTVVVNDMFGSQVYQYQLNATNPRANVLPDSTREFRDPLKNISKPGRYTLIANVTYGTGGEILIGKKTFWYLPPWVVAIIVVVLLALAVSAAWAYRRYRRGSRHSYRRRK